MAAREDVPLPVRRWHELVAAARMRCAQCDRPWLDASERWRLVAQDDATDERASLLCPDCSA